MRVGFACVWDKVPERSWSGTAWRLRGALERWVDVTDLGVRYSAVQTLLKYTHLTRHGHRRMTTYQWSPLWDKILQKKLRSSLRKTQVDAVIEIGDLARLDVPYYLYQDLNFEVLERLYDPAEKKVPYFPGIDLDTIKRRRDREQKIYESAAGVFAMSEWFANTLVEWSGVSPDKVTVVYAGLNVIGATPEKRDWTEARTTRDEAVKLLFVGSDFFRKGGDIVLKALALLRRECLPNVQLTVAGPDRWPLAADIPEGVVFVGRCTTADIAQLYHDHDLFVMPSRFEAFGIAFIEALAHGVPVIGRSTFAMPEIIRPGKNGALVHTDDPAELASTIMTVLDDPAVRRYTAQTMQDMRARFSWSTVAENMVTYMAVSA
jgi:glycosyltransferase involved in cell wall biosynthesis